MAATRNSFALDASAISISGLCLLHCLALPLLSAFLPIAGALAEAEWVHAGLVLIAIPITGFVIFRHLTSAGSIIFPIVAVIGLLLLLAGAFVEPLHDFEVLLTVLGAITLAAAHIGRWMSQGRRPLPAS